MALETAAQEELIAKVVAAKHASRALARLDAAVKTRALHQIAEAILAAKKEILFRNEIDVEAARETNLSAALIDRLILNESRIDSMARGIHEIADQTDPVGEIVERFERPQGFTVEKVRVPLGVIAIIYESRPNVTADAAALCLKAGNAVILKGGREASETNRQIAATIAQAATAAGIPDSTIGLIESRDRDTVTELVRMEGLIDVVIARGSEEMIRAVREQAIVPVLGHGKGLCHTYIDKSADIAMAHAIAMNAKTQRPGVCNAMECLLIHEAIASRVVERLFPALKAAGVEIRGCEQTRALAPWVNLATEEDYRTEYLDLRLSVKIVSSLEEAIHHITRYGSGHSDAIVTHDDSAAEEFVRSVDSAAVFHNASTRLHDGGIFGLGAEIGISTQKLHARGAMGVRELTTTKYIVRGSGTVRQ